jgi:(R,R)-butanediol dehydrogenase/meso-butanediol dehydrogenase/diacetyl reductase
MASRACLRTATSRLIRSPQDAALATNVLDAKERDLAQLILEASAGQGAHVVIEASGAPTAPQAAVAATRRGGRVLIVGLQSAPREIDLFALTVHEIEITTTLAHVCDIDLPESLQIISGSDLAQSCSTA